LNLDELIRQQIVMNLPIQVLCDANCRGLCSHCGSNLNQGACDCETEAVDSPFAGLATLLREDENGRSPE